MGKNFAYMQLKAIWTVLLDRFDFTADSRFPRPNYGSWVTGPETPCRVRYRRRAEAGRFPMSGVAGRLYDVAIVGAGPVGSLCALAHARKGARVALLEANPRASERLAGEWLHPPAIRILREVGIDVDTLPGKHAGQGIRGISGGRLRADHASLSGRVPGSGMQPCLACLAPPPSYQGGGQCRIHFPRAGQGSR